LTAPRPPDRGVQRAHRCQTRVEAAFLENPELSAVSGPGDFYGSGPLVRWVAETLYIGGYVWFVGRPERQQQHILGGNQQCRQHYVCVGLGG
jgi:hypothetical protein